LAGPARALVLEQPRRLVERDFVLPEIGDDDALLRVEACGLCGTDHEEYTGEMHPGYAFVPGHETVGVLAEIGPRAAERWGVQAGDRIAVEVFQRCGECAACLRGDYRECERHGLADMYGFVPVETPPGLWGGYAEYQYLGPDALVLPVPDGIDPVLATMFNPLGAGIRWGVTLPGTKAGDSVVVLGPGVRGLSALAAAKEAGAGFVTVTGRGERDAPRLAAARAMGADLVIDVEREDPIRLLVDETGHRADVVLDVTAKAPEAVAQAIGFARTGGTVVLAGTRGPEHPARIWPDAIVQKELTILGALGVDTDAYRAAFELLASGRYPFADLPRTVASLDEAEYLVQTMAGETDETPPVHGVLVP
jgi:alcohol dehydrogenase